MYTNMPTILCLCAVMVACLAPIRCSVINRRASYGKCGVEASSNLIHHNPWLVYLDYYREGRHWEVVCAGSLVTKRHVITAAHCVYKQRFSRLVARLGEYDVNSKVDCVQGVCADPLVFDEVSEVTIHPAYDGSEHDIAVLTLKEDAPYTDFIRPICLPSGEMPINAVFSAAGWGEVPLKSISSHVKKIIPLPYWDRERCQSAYKYNSVPDHVICAGGEEGVDTCRGDSGGPLTLIRDRTELWGVTSAGNTRCGTKDSPAFYTNVAHHMAWINEIIS